MIVTAEVFSRANLKDFKIDTLQKLIDKNRYFLKNCGSPELAEGLA